MQMTKAQMRDEIEALESALESILDELSADEPDLDEVQRIAEDTLGIEEELPTPTLPTARRP